MEAILQALWLFLPAGVANATPVIASHIPALQRLKMPVDAGRTFRGKRILGDNKTVRGFLSGIFAATLVACLQMYIASAFPSAIAAIELLDYSDPIVILAGAAMGFGALFGDAIESFFKRQASIASGQSWYFFDQVDYIIGGCLALLPFIVLSASQYVWVAIVWLVVHPATTCIAWLLKLKDSPI